MRTAIAFVLCAWLGLAGAQAQKPDLLVTDGRAEPLAVMPLQRALESDAALRGKLQRYLSKKPCPEAERGYVATWELRDNALMLVKLDVEPCGGGKTVPLSLLFPSASVTATWYSGELKTQGGKTSRVVYVKAGQVTGAATVEKR